MKTKVHACTLLAVLIGSLSFSASASYFTRVGSPGWWGDETNWDTMPTNSTTTIKFNRNDGSPLEAYLNEGDDFAHTNATLSVGCHTRAGTSVTTAKVTIPTGATLRVKAFEHTSYDGTTGIVDVVGGTLKVDGTFKFGGNGIINVVGGTMKGSAMLGTGGSGTIRVKDGEVGTLSTFGWTDKGVVEADNSIVRGGSGWVVGNKNSGNYVLLKNGSLLAVPGNINIGANGGDPNSQCDFFVEDSLVSVTGNVNFANAHTCHLMLTNSTLLATGDFSNGRNGCFLSGPTERAYVEQIGASSNVFSGAITAYGNLSYLIDGEKAYLTGTKLALSTLAESVTQRFDFVSGEIKLTGDGLSLSGTGKVNFYQKGGTLATKKIVFGGETSGLTKRYDFLGGKIDLTSDTSGCLTSSGGAGVFSIRGSAPELTLSKVAESESVLLEYVIDRTGTPCIQFVPAGISANNWMKGTHVAKLDGGLQLLHTNTIIFVDTQAKTPLHACGTGAPGETTYGAGTYYDLNQAKHHLWTFGPHTNPSSNPIGVLAGSKCFGAQLTAEEEFQVGQRYDEAGDERSCGWVRLPKIRPNVRICRVMLDVEPKGDHTLAEIADGLTAAGYSTKCVSGAYNLQVTIPAEDLRVGSTNEVVAFDFAEYNTPNTVKTMTPSDVRAVVRQVNVVIDPGLMLLLR